MKKRINLLHVQEKYKRYYHAFNLVKYASVGMVGCFFIILLIFFFLLNIRNEEYKKLLTQRKEDIEYLMANQKTEAEFVLFGNKLLETSRYLKDDANFYPYYNVLNNSLKQASEEARFQSIHIDKNKNVKFIIELPNYQNLLSFFKFIESDAFLNKFENLILARLDLTEVQNTYQLSFTGKFKEIDDIKN